MKGVHFTFLLPYVSTLLGAAYNIQHALDGLGLHSVNFVERDPHGRIVGSYFFFNTPHRLLGDTVRLRRCWFAPATGDVPLKGTDSLRQI